MLTLLFLVQKEQLTARNDALRVEIAAVEAELEGMRRLLK